MMRMNVTIYLSWGGKKYLTGLSLEAARGIYDDFYNNDDKIFNIEYNGVPVFIAERQNILCIDFENAG